MTSKHDCKDSRILALPVLAVLSVRGEYLKESCDIRSHHNHRSL